MQIRTKLTFYYVAITASLLLGAFIMIFFMYRETRSNKFNTSLKNRALTTANLYFKINEIDSNLLNVINQNNKDLYDLEKISIFNEHKHLVYDSRKSIFPGIKSYLTMLTENKKFLIEKNEKVILGFRYYNKKESFYILAHAKDVYGLRNYENLKKILTLVFFIISSLLALTGWLFTKRIMKPVSNIMNQVDEISPINLNARLVVPNSKDELSRLVNTFNNMLQRIEKAFKVQQNFTSNAAHELKNPLTIITSQLEVALLKDRTEQEYKKICESILEDIKRLNDTTNQLFLITKLSNEVNSNTETRFRIDDLIWDLRSEVLERDKEAKIEINLAGLPDSDSQLYFTMNEVLMKTCLQNLIGNALKFSENNTMSINLYFENNKVNIDFINSGQTISPDDLESVFEPFFRSKSSMSIQGFGVGLALVKQITTLYKIDLSYSITQSGLNCFSLTFL